MGSKKERVANKRLWYLIFASIVIVELGWWIAEEVFCEPIMQVDSKGEKEVAPNDSFFCRISG
ncbi:hypothetical protein RM545_07145 [Zunongwangia sp. F260]|uniref:Uncharacterized protein n=1 Tax=Autumnicola lenta TaxID=3075593 RepID=A0ABU3CJC6_9FLAO|nr:hypothetical protein [Zunongwangia sp. F260]MDT0646459.1 hypothetical protein [Zunongwangia sp. F260]